MPPSSSQQNFGNCQLGDVRLNRRALQIGQALSEKFGQALSMVFDQARDLKRAYEFSQIPKQPSRNSLPRTAL